MKKTIYIIVVPIIVVTLYWFFNALITSYKQTDIINTQEIIKEDYKEYLIGVVACEMPASYNIEALKAQTIASRTFLYNKLNANPKYDYYNSKDQCYITKDEMHDKWENDYELYYNKIEDVVNSTSSIVMNKDNKLFSSYYFAISSGITEDSETVFKTNDTKSVTTELDKTAKNYKVINNYTKEELSKIIGVFNTIKVSSISNTNHVEIVNVDNNTYTGIEFRKLLNLRSTSFTIETNGNDITITTYGYGHDVGLSQYGSNELAKLGYDYESILKYYYNDINLVNY